MPLDRLMAEKSTQISTWQNYIGTEIAKRTALFSEQQGRPPTQEEGQDMIDDIVKNSPLGIKDIFFIQSKIASIYADRLHEEVESILAKKSKKDRLQGIIDLFGLAIATEDDAAYSNILYKELGEVLPAFILPEQFTKGKQGLLNNRHNPNDSPIAVRFIVDNWSAIIAELQKREREKRSREAYGYARGGKTTDTMLLMHRAKKPTDKDVNIGEISLGGVKITLGEAERELTKEGEQGTLPGFSNIKGLLSPNLQQSVLYLLKCLHDGGVRAGRIEGCVSDFMKKRAITEREAKEQLRAGMTILKYARLSNTSEAEGDFENVYMFGGTEKIMKGKFFFSFNDDFRQRYFAQPAIPFALKLFEVNTQYNPYSTALGWKMMSHFNMNKADKNANRISVRSLLNVCEMYGLPTYEEVIASDRAVYRRIIEPFQRDMNLLEDMHVLSWRYADRGKDGTEEIPLAYPEFTEKIIVFDLFNYPDPAEQIKEIKAGRERRKRAKEKGALKKLERQGEYDSNNL